MNGYKVQVARKAHLASALFGLAAVILLSVGAPQGVRAESAEDAQRLVESLADKAVTALGDRDIEREERVRRFQALLEENFDVDVIGRWVLGRYWRDATPAQREEFRTLYERMIVNTYVDRFTEYSGEKLSVINAAEIATDDILVRSQLVRATAGPPVQVDWRVHAREQRLRIVDVIVEGVSMGQTQRSEFASVIRQGGGDMEALLRKMREIK
jgi:phospholipid transport system substrate-binding protein